MKTYLLNIPAELKTFSQKLDAKALLCKKTWEVFNDEGDKQVWIFQNNGNLIISNNGNATNVTWQFFPANTSILITAEGQSTLLRPVMVDGIIFAMQKDGTQECLFLINEQEQSICPHRTLAELNTYFAKKIEALEGSPEYVPEKKQQKEQKEWQEEQERIAKIAAEHQDEIDTLVKQKKKKALVAIVISAVVFVASVLLQLLIKEITDLPPIVAGSIIAGIVFFISYSYFENAEDNAREEVVSKYR